MKNGNVLATAMAICLLLSMCTGLFAMFYRRKGVKFWDDVPPQMTVFYPEKMRRGGMWIRRLHVVLLILVLIVPLIAWLMVRFG